MGTWFQPESRIYFLFVNEKDKLFKADELTEPVSFLDRNGVLGQGANHPVQARPAGPFYRPNAWIVQCRSDMTIAVVWVQSDTGTVHQQETNTGKHEDDITVWFDPRTELPPRNPPIVTILQPPEDLLQYPDGATVTFIAKATDGDGNPLTGAALEWTTEFEVTVPPTYTNIGEGEQIDVTLPWLPSDKAGGWPSSYSIAVTATDPQRVGLMKTAYIDVLIGNIVLQ